jgi:secreted PhoX family phosphatase
MARSESDDTQNLSTNLSLRDVIAERGLSRRSLLTGGLGLGALALLGCGDNLIDRSPTPDAGPDPDPDPDPVPTRPTSLGFEAVPKNLLDTITVPAGYTATVLYALGDPLTTGVSDYANDGTDAPASFALRAGDHHDGMHFFGVGGTGSYDTGSSKRGVLCINHEAITPLFLHPAGPTIVGTGAAAARTVPGEVEREFYCHGVSVVDVSQNDFGGWKIERSSPLNRRIHTLTEMELSGPLRGAASMITKFSPLGTHTRGTVNNCANGFTPWAPTSPARRTGPATPPHHRDRQPAPHGQGAHLLHALGIAGNGRELWATVTPDTTDALYGRWNTMVLGATAADDFRNVANTFGWVVEIDPFDPTAAPKKRTAHGRFAHEGAWPSRPVAGKPLVFYSGDDSRGEYIYKFVSTQLWDPADADRTDRLAVGDKYLDSGTLYAAKFHSDGTGEWLELAFGKNNITASNATYAFADQADVLLNARLAADVAGATKMDRPEWGAVDPVTDAVYLTLTNNSASVRSLAATDAANPRHYNDPKTVNGTTSAQFGNPNGHIVRWLELSPRPPPSVDVFLFAAADAGPPSTFEPHRRQRLLQPRRFVVQQQDQHLLIQTGTTAFTDVTNCMLPRGAPGGRRRQLEDDH